MNRKVVSLVAVLICCLIMGVVVFFGYSQFKAAQAANAAYGQQIKTSGSGSDAALRARMPDQLSQH